MASPTQWTWVWASSGSWWWTGTLTCCSPWGCRVEHNWVTELNWTERQDTIFKQPERKDRLPIDLWQLIGNWLACQLWLYKVFLTISYNIQKELPFACIPLIHIGLVLHMIWIRGVIFFRGFQRGSLWGLKPIACHHFLEAPSLIYLYSGFLPTKFFLKHPLKFCFLIFLL